MTVPGALARGLVATLTGQSGEVFARRGVPAPTVGDEQQTDPQGEPFERAGPARGQSRGLVRHELVVGRVGGQGRGHEWFPHRSESVPLVAAVVR